MIAVVLQSLSALAEIINIVKKWIKPSNKPNRNRLINHPFFQQTEFWIVSVIDNLPIESPLKKKYVSLFLKIQFKIFRDNILNWAKINHNDDVPPTDIVQVMVSSIQECKVKCVEMKIPDIVLERMSIWQESKLEIFLSSLQDICMSNFYSNIENKKTAILDISQVLLHLVILDAEITVNKLNGQLEKTLTSIKND